MELDLEEKLFVLVCIDGRGSARVPDGRDEAWGESARLGSGLFIFQIQFQAAFINALMNVRS